MSSHPYLGTRQIPALRDRLDRRFVSDTQKASSHLELWWHLLRLGENDESAEQLEAAFKLIESMSNLKAAGLQLHYNRVLTNLRQAEVSNCIRRHNRDCCLFPLARGGIHTDTGPAEQARRSLLVLLESKPDDLKARWLLNVVSMAVGDYPDGVPESYRIAPTAFDSEYDIKRFVDIAPALGLDTFNLCGGVIVEDFDGDGYLDIVTSTYDPRGPLVFYRNRADGTFEERSQTAGLDKQLGGLNCIGGDYDNDGDVDILVLRGAWLQNAGRIRNSLLENNGDGTFIDVTPQAGLAYPPFPTQAAVWGDFDNDGDLDLYVGNESRLELAGEQDCPSQLFQNNGDLTFTDVAGQAGVSNDRYAKGVTAGDYDNDGDVDLYVSNAGPNRLYRNNGDGTFTDVAKQLGVTEPSRRSFACWFFDYNNDGWLDLFVAAYEANTADIAADYLGQQHGGSAPCLYRNEANGTFTNITRSAGLDHPYLPMGANFGDLDNDGYLDFYLATGDPLYESLMPNIMLRNDRGRSFQDVTTSGGFGHLQKGHGVAFADLDNDGDQDIYHQLGGFFPGDKFHNALFLNPGHANRFLSIKLVGTSTNRSALGARIRVIVDSPGGKRTFHRAVGSVSSFGGSPLRLEVGLGHASRIERVEIDWPRSNTTQVLTDVPVNSFIEVTEGGAGFQSIQLKSLQFKT